MRFLSTFLFLSPFLSLGLAQDFDAAEIPKEKFNYQVCDWVFSMSSKFFDGFTYRAM